jgi:ketosteroid isomerase-like protein
MIETSTEAVIRRFYEALAAEDFAGLSELMTDDVTDEYPQSGERFRGKDNLRAVVENYPGRQSGGLSAKVDRVVGSGDQCTVVTRITYPNGQTWHGIDLVELRNGKIAKVTSFFGAPFEAPAWREPYREKAAAR